MRYLLTLLSICSYLAASAQSISIPFSSPINANGSIDPSEWQLADSAQIRISANLGVKVLFQHDGNNLNLAYLGNLQTPSNYFPELMIDANNDRSSSIQSDDWWFHVSATDCEYQGAYGNYSLCMLVRPNWIAIPNFTPTAPFTDTVEISIPFQTLGLNVSDTIGLCFLVNNFQSFRYAKASSNHLNPSTWSSYVISTSATSIEESEEKSIRIWPNPTNSFLNIDLRHTNGLKELRLLDMSGQVIINESEFSTHKIQWDLTRQERGVYFLMIKTKQGKSVHKIIRMN